MSLQIAAATAGVLSKICAPANGMRPWSRTKGIYHMTAGGETTWYNFAQLILELASSQPRVGDWFAAATNNRPLMARRIVPIATDEFPTPARRPAYSVLANRKLNDTFGMRLPHWEMQLRAVFSGCASDTRTPGTNEEQATEK